MGMKFHKIHVAILVPLAILLIAITAVLMLFVAFNVSFVADNAALPYLSNLEAGTVLWTLFGLTVALFLLMLMTEFLLVAQKRTGILLLSLSLMLGGGDQRLQPHAVWRTDPLVFDCHIGAREHFDPDLLLAAVSSVRVK